MIITLKIHGNMASLIARLSSTLFFTIEEKIKVPIAVTIQPTVKIKKQIINFESNPWVVIQRTTSIASANANDQFT